MKRKAYWVIVVLVVVLLTFPFYVMAANCTLYQACMDSVSYTNDWVRAPVQMTFYYDETPYIRVYVNPSAPSSESWNLGVTMEWTDPLGNTHQGEYVTGDPAGSSQLYSLPDWSYGKMSGTWTVSGSYVETWWHNGVQRTNSGTFNSTSFTVLTESTPPSPPDPNAGYNFYNGNVTMKNRLGVGTANPGTRLHVRQSDSGYLPDNVSGIFVESKGSLNDYYVFQAATKGGGKSFSITNAGNVGIGTTRPQSKLAVSGLPNTPPLGSTNRGIVCITTVGDMWVDDDGVYDCR